MTGGVNDDSSSLGGNNGEQERFGGIIAGKLISSPLIYCGKLNFLEVGARVRWVGDQSLASPLLHCIRKQTFRNTGE